MMDSNFRHILVEPEAHGFGARVNGISIDKPLTAAVLEEVKEAWARHSVIYFPDQPLSHTHLEAFTLQLGEFGIDPYIVPMEAHPHILESCIPRSLRPWVAIPCLPTAIVPTMTFPRR